MFKVSKAFFFKFDGKNASAAPLVVLITSVILSIITIEL
jgi:hypothetical protein